MSDIREEAIAQFREQYNIGEYAEQVLDWLVDMCIFKPYPHGYLYDSEHFPIDQDTINRIVDIIKKTETFDKEKLREMDHDTFMAYGDSNPRGRADPDWNAERKRRYRNYQAKNYRRMKKEGR